MNIHKALESQRLDFANRKFLATPLAGLMVWLAIGFVGVFCSKTVAVWSIFIGTGSIIYLAIGISKFTGEDFLKKSRPKNEFDRLFFLTVAQALLVYSIAIPFFLTDYTSLPLSVGILTGLMWLPFSWMIKHWVGIFHAISRTVLVVLLWYLLPQERFVAIPFGICALYVITLFILRKRRYYEQT